jgi:hypothetical protein
MNENFFNYYFKISNIGTFGLLGSTKQLGKTVLFWEE